MSTKVKRPRSPVIIVEEDDGVDDSVTDRKQQTRSSSHVSKQDPVPVPKPPTSSPKKSSPNVKKKDPPPASMEIDLTETQDELLEGGKVQCPICLDDKSLVSDIYSFDCRQGHMVCRDCVERFLAIATGQNKLLHCPLCQEAIHADEVKRLLGKNHPYAVSYADRELEALLNNNHLWFVRCPKKDCPSVVEITPELKDRPTRLQCKTCRTLYCSMCREDPPHGLLSCREAKEVRATWNQFASRLAAHGADPEVVKDQQNRLLQYQQLCRDEQEKEKRCVLCPGCHRVIEKIDGCDKMVCGRDTEGGNVQAGCGKKLQWSKARKETPYRADCPPPPQVDDLVKEIESTKQQPPGVVCAGCQSRSPVPPFVGLSFQCANCLSAPCYCFSCLLTVMKEHPPSHYFHIRHPTMEVQVSPPPPLAASGRGGRVPDWVVATINHFLAPNAPVGDDDDDDDYDEDDDYEDDDDEEDTVVHCHCGVPATELVSHSARNPGRRFLTCGRNRRCRFFQWVT